MRRRNCFTILSRKWRQLDTTALEVSVLYNNLLAKIEDRKDQSSIPFTASNYLRNLECYSEEGAKAVANNFYHEIVKYMRNWRKRLVDHEALRAERAENFLYSFSLKKIWSA